MKKISIGIFVSVILTFAVMCIMSYTETEAADVLRTRPEAVYATQFVQKDLMIDGGLGVSEPIRIRYIDEGIGFPILLIPGHMSRIEALEPLVVGLKDSFRVLVFDFPGSGYSDKPDREYSLLFYDGVILDFLNTLGINECYLVGGSLGGNLAIRLGYTFSDRFPRVVAWGPGSTWEAKPWGARVMRVIAGRATFWPTVRWQSQFWLNDDNPSKELNLKESFSYFREIMSPGFVRMYWDMAADQVGWSLYSIAPEMTTPVLLMLGEHDRTPEMQDGVRRLHREMQHSEFHVIRGASHAIAITHADELTTHLREFLLRPGAKLP